MPSLMAGATTCKETLFCSPNLENDSKIPTTVPKSPIKGDVEAMIEMLLIL